MKWPWQRQPEHRSGLTDQIVAAIQSAASGGGVKPALATASLGSCAILYASALSACSVSGPSSVMQAFNAQWRANLAASLLRRGEALYVVGASVLDGLSLAPVASWDIHGGADRLSWVYRIERAGPSATAWETHSAESLLHLKWITDAARPWRGISPLQHASDSGSLAAWLERRLSEEASGPTGAFLPLARYQPADNADLADADADDPLAQLRRDIGGAKGQTLLVESQMAQADSAASAPRKDFQVARFGADPPRALVELREQVARDIGAACGVPRALLDATASGQSQREGWRQFISTSVDGLMRRIESQIVDQLGVEVTFDSSPLGGRDVLARASAFRRLHEGGLTVAEARDAAGV